VNIALPAGTLLLLLLPGLLLVHSFLGHIGRRHQEPAGQSGITWPWLVALLLAPFFHVSLSGFNRVLEYPEVDYQAVFFLLTGKYDNVDQYKDALGTISKYRWYIGGYFIEAAVVAILSGTLARVVVRRFKLDRNFAVFRFGNDWHYLLSGELACEKEPDGVIVSVTVAVAGKCYLYIGLLESFVVGPAGQLARIHLKEALRRSIDADRKPGEVQPPLGEGEIDPRYYQIRGDELVIMARDVHTVNVQYIVAEESTGIEDGQGPQSLEEGI
jgi:hypothetical protein